MGVFTTFQAHRKARDYHPLKKGGQPLGSCDSRARTSVFYHAAKTKRGCP